MRMLWLAAAALLLTGCPDRNSTRTLTIYCAHDQVHSQEVIDRFERETGIAVRCKWDTETSKTTGLVNTLIAEGANPRCDVFWNNEVSQTIVLAERGLLQPYVSPQAADIPAHFKDASGLWTGFGARARLLIVNTELVPEDQRPTGLKDLLDPKWKGRIGIAKPLFGTTATHAAAMFALWGPDKARAFFEALKANEVIIAAGNAHLKDRVAAGEFAFGLTDTDDFNLARLAGAPVVGVFPDQDGEGTLLIPNSVMMMKGAPHPKEAQAFIDFLLQRSVEAQLAEGRAAQLPVRAGVARPDWIPAELVSWPVDWAEVGQQFRPSQDWLQSEFLK